MKNTMRQYWRKLDKLQKKNAAKHEKKENGAHNNIEVECNLSEIGSSPTNFPISAKYIDNTLIMYAR